MVPLGTPTSYDQLVDYNFGEAFGGTDPLNPVSDGFLDYLHIGNPALSQSYTEISTGSFDIHGEEHLMLYLDSRVTSSQSVKDIREKHAANIRQLEGMTENCNQQLETLVELKWSCRFQQRVNEVMDEVTDPDNGWTDKN